MIRVIFVCSGNVCRSPMAEFVFRDLVSRAGLEGEIAAASAGTNVFAPNSPVHGGTQRELRRHGVPFEQRGSQALYREDYAAYDYLVGMERSHVQAMLRLFGKDPENKLCRMLDWSGHPRDIDDPWYTGDFITTYREIAQGCETLLHHVMESTGLKAHGAFPSVGR